MAQMAPALASEAARLKTLSCALKGSSGLIKSDSTNNDRANLTSGNVDSGDEQNTRPISAKEETLLSTPTRIPITTTKTCGSDSLENRSSCQSSEGELHENQRESVYCAEPLSRNLLEKKVTSVAQSQTRLSLRCRKLEKRLRVLQSRQLENHVTEQLQTFALNRRKSQQIYSHSKEETKHNEVLPSTKKKTIETTINSVTCNRQGASLSDNSKKEECTSGENTVNNIPEKSVVNLDVENDGNAARTLVCQLELTEHVGDSDATECSSGGESCDEMDLNIGNNDPKPKGFSNPLTQFYADRGSIASKWTWLRSQVIDIERRIRRCEETYKTVRGKKMAIRLNEQRHGNDQNVLVSLASQGLINHETDIVASKLNHCNDKESTNALSSINNFVSKTSTNLFEKDLLLNMKKSTIKSQMNDIDTCTAARTRSVKEWRKRKLFHLSKLERSNSSLLCSCEDLCMPCVLCRQSPPSLPKMMPKQSMKDRVALVDLAFHPVLSFDNEIPLSLHFGSLLKKGNFQSRIFKLNAPNDHKTFGTKRKYVRSASTPGVTKKKEGKETLATSYKKHDIRNLRDRKNKKKTSSSAKNDRILRQKSSKVNKRSAAVSAGLRLSSQLQKRARSLSLPSGSSRPSSPMSNTPSPTTFNNAFGSGAFNAKKKKPNSNAFDINNIVIPYSMASTTRVEKLQYKEILTPAWREITITPKEHGLEEDDENLEDLSNLSFALRHLKCEENERKRFVGLAIKKKKRPARSEATTPEPVSPGSLLFDGHLTANHNSSGAPSPTSTNPSLSNSLNVTSPTGLSGALVNMLPSDPLNNKVERSAKSSKQNSNRKHSSIDIEDSCEAWPVIEPWPLRTFPLSDTDFDRINNPPTPNVFSVPPSPVSSRTTSPIHSPVGSPDSTTVNSNWTVKLLSTEAETPDNTELDSKPPRKGIVLKLAKR